VRRLQIYKKNLVSSPKLKKKKKTKKKKKKKKTGNKKKKLLKFLTYAYINIIYGNPPFKTNAKFAHFNRSRSYLFIFFSFLKFYY
jgi:hypothetical protein